MLTGLMLSVDDVEIVVEQSKSIVDSPETVAVVLILVTFGALAALVLTAWACVKAHMRHLEDLRSLLPALNESTHVMSEVVRTVDRHIAMVSAMRPRDGQ